MVPKICFGQMPQCVSSFEKQAGFSYQTNFFSTDRISSRLVSKGDASLECAGLVADEN